MAMTWKNLRAFIELADYELLGSDKLSPLTIYFVMREVVPKIAYITVDMPNVDMELRVAALIETLSLEASNLVDKRNDDMYSAVFTSAQQALYNFGKHESLTRDNVYKCIAYATCTAVLRYERSEMLMRLAKHNESLRHTTIADPENAKKRTKVTAPNLTELCARLAVHTLVLMYCDPKNEALMKLTE